MRYILIVLFFLNITSLAFALDIDFDTIAMIESSNNPLAYNQSSGARGIFQNTLADLFDPAISKHIAIWYLTERIPQMLRHNKEEVNIRNVLICYNFGIGNFLKWDGDIETLPIETRNYLDRYNWYKGGAR